MFTKLFSTAVGFLVFWSCGSVTSGAYQQAQLPLRQVPQEHDYQKKLRAFMATLQERDFTVEPQELTVAPADDPDQLFRLWLLTLHPPQVSAARLPAAAFRLSAIEADKGLVLPVAPAECQMLAWLANWKYAGNPYHGAKSLELRAFVLAAVDLMMLDYLYEHDPQGADRSDYLGGNLIWLGYTFSVVHDALPPEVQAAFAAGLKKLVVTLNRWGPKGLMTDMDLFAPVGLWYIAQALNDAEVRRTAEAYARPLFTDARFFHPAGYFVDSGCFDTSYNGISLYFGTWAALMTDWKFTQAAIDKAYRLRAHLSFPHPDGTLSGPSAMASRCSGDPPRDQWQFPPKTYGSGMVTDEALYIAPLPAEDRLRAAPKTLITQLNMQLAKPREAKPQPWRESHWSNHLNYAYEFYEPGDYQRRLKLEHANSPLLKPLYLRDERFVREFDKAFVIARFDRYAAAVHTGPVGGIHQEWQRPYGFGGGQLCAFWTPDTGPVILTRRRGVQGAVFDRFDEWRRWPVHAVSGLTASGDLITSTRIQTPEVESQCSATVAEVRVSGMLPKYVAAEQRTVATGLRYQRRFLLTPEGVRIETSVEATGDEKSAELYETIPVFLCETAKQPATTIRFQVGSTWRDAAPEPQANVRGVRIDRASGQVQIAFARPVTARLSPDVWQDGFQTRAQCCTVLVDLLPCTATSPRGFSVSYTISAAAATGMR